MPIFGYQCKSCKHEYEILYTSQSKAKEEEPKEKCPKCESLKKKRLPPKNTSFVLNGKGWYRDKYE